MELNIDFLSVRKKGRSPIPSPPEELLTFPSPEDIEYEPESGLEDLRRAAEIEPREEKRPEEKYKQLTSDGPTYIKINAYRGAIGGLQLLRSSLEESEEKIVKLEETDKKQEHLYRQWHDTVKGLHEKLIFVDEMLFKRR